MKKLTIDDNKCVSCGACLSYNEYFFEDKLGKAKVDESALLLDKDLFSLNEIISLCPTNAITISEVKIPDNIDTILSNLRDDLFNCLITYKDRNLFVYDKEKYSLAYPDSPNFYGSDYKYSSRSKALDAGLEEFNRYVYSKYRKIILELFVQYKMDKIYPYYDLSESSNIYNTLENIKQIFNKYAGQINAFYNKGIIPTDIGKITIDLDNDLIKQEYRDISEFENFSTTSGVWSDFKEGSYSSLSSYKSYIDTDDFEKYMGSGLFGDKYKTMYRHSWLREVTDEFYRDIQRSMAYVDLNEKAASYVNLFIRAFNYLLLTEFYKKFSEIESIINHKFDGIEELKEVVNNRYRRSNYLDKLIGKIDPYLY